MVPSSDIIEIRQYTLHPGRRDELIALFDREFVESQEEVGMTVLGQFRVVDEPQTFFWLRGFPDMECRKQGLTAFYDGPIWQRHKAAANATMIDSDNVLLLRPARRTSVFAATERSDPGAASVPPRAYIASICYLDTPLETSLANYFEAEIAPLTKEYGQLTGYFVTQRSENNFPRLPIRENENAFAWFLRLNDRADVAPYTRRLMDKLATAEDFRPHLQRPLETKLLIPTDRSRLR